MRKLIAALFAWLLGVLAPGSGWRRFGTAPATPPSIRRTEEAVPTLRERFGLPRERTARPRSPYGLMETFDGEAMALIRPYFVECERQEERARQRWRCLSLVMAADFGTDLDTRDVHATGVAW
ncbi:hypothetical protein CF54_04600 [Streptomyces sp. Tu 6176]|uniref:hypothetical protein n=1 Tax=Streptomyces sp. Tu 6176 TaxID=1470557 RepID=UPI0004464750|nr:hypothetical protein [Streptomyces sp. Tu 6176]EYT83899.1 hypothetical protein CF54_04600 [Streptomyces sp. Tu 6176]